MRPRERSAQMALIHSRDTKPELVVRRQLHALGYRYRLHVAELPGKPDLVFPARKKVIFVHGCFWHRHSHCSRCRLPKSRLDYWKPKLERNVKRDRIAVYGLRRSGWRVLVVWECETLDPKRAIKKATRFLEMA
jgi:DNA mismatch endonuclease (patch repair protein)